MSKKPKILPEEKLRGILDYCLVHGSNIGKVPKTKLFKLVYLADFSSYYFTGKSISGLTYKKREHGPVADELFVLVDEMTEAGDIDIDVGEYAFFHRLTVKPTSDNYLTKQEIKFLKNVCDYWKDKSTKEIVKFTHSQRPWFLTKPQEEIPFELILQEDHPFLPPKSYG